jgi:hypothetical protein
MPKALPVDERVSFSAHYLTSLHAGGEAQVEPGIRVVAARLAFAGRVGGEGDVEPEAAAPVRLALDAQLSAHRAHESLADRQAEPRPSGRRAGLRLSERLEDRLRALGLDADSRVRDVEAQPIGALARDRQPHGALLGELGRVPEEVEQHLAEVATVDHDAARHLGRDVDFEAQLLPARRLDHEQAQIGDELAELGAGRLHLHAPGLDLREVEHLVDEIEEMQPHLVMPSTASRWLAGSVRSRRRTWA